MVVIAEMKESLGSMRQLLIYMGYRLISSAFGTIDVQ